VSFPSTRSKIPLTVMFIPRYEVTSVRREVTQKVELEVELDMAIGMVALSIGMVALSIGMVALSIGIVEFMVELATNGSVLTVSDHPTIELDKLTS
jgi:hypothetical protein